MKIKTSYYGEIEIDEAKILHFDFGLPGLEKENKFIILPIENNPAFQIMQSIESGDLAFVICNPYNIVRNYSFNLDKTTIHYLKVEKTNEIAVFAIVSIKQPFEMSTINLKAPIVLNTSNQKAKQVILDDEQFSVRHQISLESQEG